MPISTNKNRDSGARVRYATLFNVRRCQTDKSSRALKESQLSADLTVVGWESSRCAARVKRRSPIAYKPTLFRLVLTVILCRDVGVCTYRLHTGNDVKCSIIKHRSLSERCTEFWIHVNSFISFHLLLRRSSKLVVSFDSDSYLIRHVFTIHHKPHCDCDIGMARLCMSCLMI